MNPDGVVRGSGIFAGGWGAARAAVYGVEEEELGAFYAQRSLLKPRGAARTRGCRGHRAGLERIQPHDRITGAGGRRSGRRVPPLTPMGRHVFAAVDLGVSAGRVMAGVIERGSVSLHEVHRFPNGVRKQARRLRWPITELFEEVLFGLGGLLRAYPDVESIGIDTWGIDHVARCRRPVLAEPVSYRDERTAERRTECTNG